MKIRTVFKNNSWSPTKTVELTLTLNGSQGPPSNKIRHHLSTGDNDNLREPYVSFCF